MTVLCMNCLMQILFLILTETTSYLLRIFFYVKDAAGTKKKKVNYSTTYNTNKRRMIDSSFCWRRPLKAYVFNFSLAVVLIVFLLVRSCLLMRMTQSFYDCCKKVSFKCVCPFLSLSWPGYVSSSLWTCHYKSKAYVDASLNLIKRCGRHS